MEHDYAEFSTIYDNGLRVAGLARPYGKTFALSMAVRTGAYDDPAGLPGLAHLTEHVMLTGAAHSLFESLSEQGTDVNARTGPDYTEYMVYGHCDQLEDGLKLLAEVLFDPGYSIADVEREKSVLQRELAEAMPQVVPKRNVAMDKFWGRMLGDAYYKLSSQKRFQKIPRLQASHVHSLVKSAYVPNNVSLAIVASGESDKIQAALHAAFERAAESAPGGLQPPLVAPESRPLTILNDGAAHTWVTVVNITNNATPAMRMASEVLAHHLGGGPHSELFKRFRTEQAQAYHVGADSMAWLDRTSLSASLSVRTKVARQALEYLLSQLTRFADKGLKPDQFEEARKRMKRWIEKAVDNAPGLATTLAYAALRGGEPSQLGLSALFDSSNAVTSEQANAALRELLVPESRSVFVGGRVGPIGRMRLQKLVKNAR